MPVISSRYWNMVHGEHLQRGRSTRKDLEGLQTMRVLARNMAFFLRCKEAGLRTGVPLPAKGVGTYTNFTGH